MTPQLDPIPLHEMPKYEWWSSPFHSDWYYHTPRQDFVIDPKVLEKTLDPCLKNLALLFLDYGLFTGPSCQGLHDDHNNQDKRERAYRSLIRDARAIKTKGLLLRNVENGDEILFYDPYYTLPWSFNDFFYQAEDENHGHVGYLPFYFEEEYEPIVDDIEDVVNSIPNTRFVRKQNLAVVKVYGYTVESQCETWNTIYRTLVRYV